MRICTALLQSVLLIAGGWSPTASTDPATVHAYQVRVSADLKRLSVEARLSGPVASLQARELSADRYLRQPRLCNGQDLRVRRNRLRLPETSDACVRYDVDLEELAQRRAYRRRSYQSLDRLTAPAAWLWQPTLTQDAEIQVTFDLPAGIRVSVPWEPLGSQVENAYRFGRSPESSNAIVVFGGFDYREITVPGATLRISMLRGQQPLDDERMLAWLEAAAYNVVNVFGRFPNPSPQVIVVPVSSSWGRSAVPFGRVIRDGGEAIQFFVSGDRPLEDFLGDWTATHEFSHLLLPYVDKKWISEGFASYYQNVLMARGGYYSEQRAWQKLHEGFERGRKARPGASPNAAGRRRGGLMKVYWSGAAIALMADVALRSAPTPQTLDDVLDKLQSCCLPSERMWGGRALFVRLNELSATTIFTDLYDSYADRTGFPAVEEVYPELGLTLVDDRVTLDSNARLAKIRAEIMSGVGTASPQAALKELTP